MNEHEKQVFYRDARFKKYYDGIWQNTGKCVFCDLRDKYILYEECGMVLTVSLYAYIDGQMMIVPRRHVTDSNELSTQEWEALRKLMYIARKLVRDVHGIRGLQFNQKHGAQTSQRTVEHFHFNVVPFDAPDLSSWNPRELKHTPLENNALYKKAADTLIDSARSFDTKYSEGELARICVDALIVNERREVLVVKRSEKAPIADAEYTLPGGFIETLKRPLETELDREVFEETGLDISSHKKRLLSSKPITTKYMHHEPHLGEIVPRRITALCNTYLVRVAGRPKLHAGDDSAEAVWISLDTVSDYAFSDWLKQMLAAFAEKLS